MEIRFGCVCRHWRLSTGTEMGLLETSRAQTEDWLYIHHNHPQTYPTFLIFSVDKLDLSDNSATEESADSVYNGWPGPQGHPQVSKINEKHLLQLKSAMVSWKHKPCLNSAKEGKMYFLKRPLKNSIKF